MAAIATALATIAVVATSAPAAAAVSDYRIGAGIHDITGEAAESNLWGYANSLDTAGIQQRTRSRAFVIQSVASGRRVALVTADLGSIQQSVALEVVRRLRARYGSLYTEDNVMLMATHTHVGSGGQAHDPLYILASADTSLAGYSTKNFEVTVNGIVASIVRADDNLTPGSIEYVEGQLTGASRNRSLTGYNANPDAGSSYSRGSTARATFRGGHPKNDLRTQRSFLTVQRLVNGAWVNHLHDWDWETTYRWQREGGDRSITTVEWRIAPGTPTGTYRLVQTGEWKNGWTGQITTYTGTSRSFTVT